MPKFEGDEYELITDCLSKSDSEFCFHMISKKLSGLKDQKCQNFHFDFSGTGSSDDSKMTSMVSEFNFVCGRSWAGL